MSMFRLNYGALTHTGRVRPHNEDSFDVLPDRGVFVVADGMGGHERGEWASAVVVEHVRNAFLPDDFDAASTTLADALHAANRVIWAAAQESSAQIGSTAVVVLIRGNRFAVLWVGDSRAYLVRGGRLIQLTRDHTQVQAMVDRGLMPAEAARGHPLGHVLARAVGVEPTVEVDVVCDAVEEDDVFLLCSDGLTGQVDDAEIGAMLAVSDQEGSTRRLVELTLTRGAPDNVTVIAVGARQPTALRFGQPYPLVLP